MIEIVKHTLWHGIIDTLVLLPFLYLAYLLLEWLEHSATEKIEANLRKAGKAGPIVGAGLGMIPQCGFSAAAASLYAGRVISLGTLLAVFLATSDEMLPILITGGIPLPRILLILGVKVVVAVTVGYLVNFFYHPSLADAEGMDLCEKEHCHCERGIWLSALHHTLRIALFIFLVNVAVGGVVEWLGEDTLAAFVSDAGIFTYIVTALLGLVPNCAASVVLAELYVEGVLSMGGMLAGLLPGAGIGSMVLFRQNRPQKQNVIILCLLAGIGILVGVVLDAIVAVF